MEFKKVNTKPIVVSTEALEITSENLSEVVQLLQSSEIFVGNTEDPNTILVKNKTIQENELSVTLGDYVVKIPQAVDAPMASAPYRVIKKKRFEDSMEI